MIQPSKYYHIYNHANGFENIFNEERNYRFFLEKYLFYISPIADTLAYCLMPNHFHLLIKIKSEEDLKENYRERNYRGLDSNKAKQNLSERNYRGLDSDKAKQNLSERNYRGLDSDKAKQNLDSLAVNNFISQRFSNLFNSYTKSFNKFYNRRGSLFIPNFKRKEITSENYLKQVFVYIHNNPVKHGFVKKPDEWSFSSYRAYIFNKETFIIKTHFKLFRFGRIAQSCSYRKTSPQRRL